MTSPFSIFLGTLLMAATAVGEKSTPPPPTETEEASEQRIQWWREARFGMFIHRGLYALPGGVWKDNVHATGYSEWIMFDEKIPAKEYEKLAGKFNPVRFDARAWAARIDPHPTSPPALRPGPPAVSASPLQIPDIHLQFRRSCGGSTCTFRQYP